jgi:hypothetical protein
MMTDWVKQEVSMGSPSLVIPHSQVLTASGAGHLHRALWPLPPLSPLPFASPLPSGLELILVQTTPPLPNLPASPQRPSAPSRLALFPSYFCCIFTSCESKCLKFSFLGCFCSLPQRSHPLGRHPQIHNTLGSTFPTACWTPSPSQPNTKITRFSQTRVPNHYTGSQVSEVTNI